MKLQERAVLVSLNMGQWKVMVEDREISRFVQSHYQATGRDIFQSKKALIMRENFERVRKAHNSIRTFHYAHTLSWSKGYQILPSKMMFTYMDLFRKLKVEWEQAVSDFVDNFEEYKENARERLNGAFKDSDYPTENELRQSFYCEINFTPVPESGDFRVDLDEEMLNEIRSDLEKKVKVAEQEAMQELWDRLYKVVKDMVETLKDPDAVFRDTKITNITKLTGLLTMLNFSDNPDLEQKRRDIEGVLAGVSPQELRDNEGLRKNVAKEAEDILNSMKGFIG